VSTSLVFGESLILCCQDETVLFVDLSWNVTSSEKHLFPHGDLLNAIGIKCYMCFDVRVVLPMNGEQIEE
jgi:hypothetical protein